MANLDAPLLAELEELRRRVAREREYARNYARTYYAMNQAAVLARQRERYVRLLEERGEPTTRGRGRPRKQKPAPALP